jgi:hypothetical protein
LVEAEERELQGCCRRRFELQRKLNLRGQSGTEVGIMTYRIWLVLVTATLAISLWSVPSRADSQARIVRLSDIEGDIEIDRGGGQGFQRAVLNLPVIEGTRLRAGYDGYAEVEFEDSTTVRITPGTVVEFPHLALEESGAKATTVNVLEGIAYVSYAGAKGDEFLLTFDGEKVPLVRAAHIRLEMGHTKARLSVFNGDLLVESPSGVVEVKKKHAVEFAMNDQTAPTGPKALAKIQSDDWDARLEEYHERYSKSGVYRNPAFGYGFSDLVYFGNFSDLPVCGLAWRPFLASADWDPFAAGGWAWYPGSGYSWVSAYPWGWAPYHYGSWQMCPGVGWAWQPGGTWRGLNNCPDPHRHPHVLPPPHPPAEVGTPAVAHANGLRNVPFSIPVELAGPLVLRRNSAGLGVPRGAIPDMHRVSQQVERHGSVSTFTYPRQSGGVTGFGRGANSGSYSSSSSHSSSSSSPQQGGGSRGGSTSTSHNSGGSSAPSMNSSAGSSASAPRTSGGATTTPK